MAQAFAYVAAAVSRWAASAAVAAGASAGTAAAVATAAYWTTAVSLSLGASAALNGLSRPQTASIDSVMTPLKQTRPPKQWGTGRMRVAGKALAWGSGKSCNFDVWAVNEGRIDAYEQFYLNDDKVTVSSGIVTACNGVINQKYSGHTVEIYGRLGHTTETASSALVAASNGQWTANHRGNGVASIDMITRACGEKETLIIYPDGDPKVSAVARLSLVFDWRDPTQDIADPSSWKWSENAVVTHLCWEWFGRYIKCARDDYVTPSPRQMGVWTRLFEPALAYWTAAADIADEDVALKAGGTEKRYRAAVMHSFDQDPAETRKLYLSAYDGLMMRMRNGAWAIRAGKYVEPTLVLRDADVLEIDWSRGKAQKEQVNILDGTFLSPQNDFSEQPADPWIDEASVEEIGENRAPFALPSVPSHGQCRRLLKREMTRQRAVYTGVIAVKLDAGIEIGDGAHRYIRAQLPSTGFESLEDVLLEVYGQMTVDFTQMRVTVPVRMADPYIDLWDEDLEEGYGPNETTRLPLAEVEVPEVSSVAGELQGVSGAHILVRVPSPENHLYQYEVSYRKAAATNWTDDGFKDYEEVTILGTDYAQARSLMVQAGLAYEVRIRAKRTYQISDWSDIEALDLDPIPVPTTDEWRLTFKTSAETGKAAATLVVEGACAWSDCDAIVLQYRVRGLPGVFDVNQFARTATAMPIDGLLDGAVYDALISYRSKAGHIGEALVLTNAPPPKAALVFDPVADGETLSWDDMGGLPSNIEYDLAGLIPLTGGQEYVVSTSDVTSSGGTFHFKISTTTPSTSHQTATSVYLGGAYPHRINKPTSADATTGLYTFTATITPDDLFFTNHNRAFYAFASVYYRPSGAGADAWSFAGMIGSNTSPVGYQLPMNWSGPPLNLSAELRIDANIGQDGDYEFAIVPGTGIMAPSDSVCGLAYDVTTTSGGTSSATDGTYLGAKVSVYPPGYTATPGFDGVSFEVANIAALPVGNPDVAADVVVKQGGEARRIPITPARSTRSLAAFTRFLADFVIPGFSDEVGRDGSISMSLLKMGLTGRVSPEIAGCKGDLRYALNAITNGTGSHRDIVEFDDPPLGDGFSDRDLGKEIYLSNAGASFAPFGGSGPTNRLLISEVQSNKIIKVNQNCSTTFAGNGVWWGTDDTAAMDAAMASIQANGSNFGGALELTPGAQYLVGPMRYFPRTAIIGNSGRGGGGLYRRPGQDNLPLLANDAYLRSLLVDPSLRDAMRLDDYPVIAGIFLDGMKYVQSVYGSGHGSELFNWISCTGAVNLADVDPFVQFRDIECANGSSRGVRTFGRGAGTWNGCKVTGCFGQGTLLQDYDMARSNFQLQNNSLAGIQDDSSNSTMSSLKASYNGTGGNLTQETCCNIHISGHGIEVANSEAQEPFGSNYLFTGGNCEVKGQAQDTGDTFPVGEHGVLAKLPVYRAGAVLKGAECVDNEINIKTTPSVHLENYATHSIYFAKDSGGGVPTYNYGTARYHSSLEGNWYNGGTSDLGTTIPGGTGVNAPDKIGTDATAGIHASNAGLTLNGVPVI